MERYSRHNLIDWFSQDDILKKTICVVGAGAVGNEVIKSLVLLGTGYITVIDFDFIEEHNLTKSVLFRSGDVGRNKAEVAALRAAELDPNAKITAFNGDVTRFLNLQSISKYDCVISCVDNFEARIRLNEMCRLAGVDFINVGIDSRYASVEVFPFSVGQELACYECHLPISVYARIAERYSCGHLKKISFIEKKIPTTIVTSGIAGSLAASMALRLGQSNLPSSSRIMVDSISGRSTVTSDLEKVPGCPCCSRFVGAINILPSGRSAKIGKIAESIGITQFADEVFQLSEPVVVSATCSICDQHPYEGAFIGRAQSELDETARFCSYCQSASVDVRFKDEMPLSELAAIYSNAPIPISYISSTIEGRNFCFSFEDN